MGFFLGPLIDEAAVLLLQTTLSVRILAKIVMLLVIKCTAVKYNGRSKLSGRATGEGGYSVDDDSSLLHPHEQQVTLVTGSISNIRILLLAALSCFRSIMIP